MIGIYDSLEFESILGDVEFDCDATNIPRDENNLVLKAARVLQKSYSEKIHFGVTNVGKRPTFGKNDLTVETWLFDFKEDIYGKDLEIFPIFQLRPEKKFTSTDHLKNQIKQDIEAARNYIAEHELELAPSLTS